ncbi:MAG: 30S ribosomal protein S3 [Candidatus Micrarchaeia archaeon]
MAVEKKFIIKALDDLEVKSFLFRELERAGVSTINIQRTPIATRISICVRKPGMVVGKRGKAIKDLCDDLQARFRIENPQIEIIEVMQADLDAKLVAERIGKQIELRPRVKPIVRIALNEIMDAGAIGAEIRVAGKIVGKGGKAKTVSVRKGYLKKSGEPMNLVRVGRYVAHLKAGCIGVTVKIVAPETVFPDKIKIKRRAAEPVAQATPAAVEASAPEAEAKEEVIP